MDSGISEGVRASAGFLVYVQCRTGVDLVNWDIDAKGGFRRATSMNNEAERAEGSAILATRRARREERRNMSGPEI